MDSKMPEPCKCCGAEPQVLKPTATTWRVKCSKYSTLGGGCKNEGHTMFTRKAAVQVWNDKN